MKLRHKLAAASVAVLPLAANAAYTAPAAFTDAIADATTAVGIFVGALLGVKIAAVLGTMALAWIGKVRSSK